MVNVYNRNKKTVGTIGARLHFGDNTVQHSGVHLFLNQDPYTKAYHPFLSHIGLKSYHTYYTSHREVFGNTAAFMMVTKTMFDSVGGYDESFQECFEDVKLNIDILSRNKKNILVGDAVCYHLESQTRKKSEGKLQREGADLRKLVPHIVNNKKTYKYFSNIKERDLEMLLNQQTKEINNLIR